MRFVTPDVGARLARSWRRPRLLSWLSLVGACASLATVAAAQEVTIPPPRNVTERGADSAVLRPVGGLRPGDLLKVAVYRAPQLSGDFLIDSRGFVQIPGMGVIQVAGLDPAEARERLVEAMQQRGFPQPELAVQALIRVSVLGEVRQPALLPVEPGTNLVQILTIAGGPTERADLRKTRVVREGRAFVVDLEAGLAGSGAGRVILYSNDIVSIPRRTGFTRENAQFVVSLLSAALGVVTLIATLQRN